MNMNLFPKAAFVRLRYPQKFALISLLFALPLAVVLFLLASETSARINNYGYQEKYGAEYLRATRQLMQDIQQHQQLTDSSLRVGAPDLAGQISQQRTIIAQDFAVLEQVEQQYGPALKSNGAVRALQQDWQTLTSGAPSSRLAVSDERHALVLADLRALISLVGDTSYLILDPDLDSYYLMDTVLLNLPETQDLLGQTLVIGRNAGEPAPGEQQLLTFDERSQLLIRIGLLRFRLDDLKTNVQVALDNNPAQTLRPLIAEPLRAYSDALEQFLTVAAQNTVVTPGQVIDLSEFVAAAQRALDQSYQFYDAASSALQIAIQARIDYLQNRQIVTVFASLISVLLGFGIGLSVMRNISRPLSLLTAAARQVAQGDLSAQAAVETEDEIGALAATFNRMADQLRSLVGSLEDRVDVRTAQLRTSAEVGRAATSILDTDELLRTTVNLITARFGFYYAAVFTLDDFQQWAELRAATGDAGRILTERRHRLEAHGQSMVGAAITTRRARIALDVGAEAVRFDNPLLPDTRSEIALPLIIGDRVLGALDVQATQAAAFDEASAAVLQSMADQIAIALSHAEQFKQTEEALKNTRNLFDASQKMSMALDANDLLQTLVRHITPDASRAAIALFGPRDETGQPAYYEFVATWVQANDAALRAHPARGGGMGQDGDDSGMLPLPPGTRFTTQQLPVVSVFNAVTPAQPLIVPAADDDKVSPALRALLHDLGAEALIALALTAGQNPLGILIMGYGQARTFNTDYLQTLVTLSNQAASVIQNRRALADTQAALEQLDLVNRRLTGKAWQSYTARLGGALTIRDVAPEAEGEATPTALDAPIVVRGEPIGVLKLQDINPDRAWSAHDHALLDAVANEIAVAIDNARLLEQVQIDAEREHTLNRIAGRLRNAQSVEQVLNIATQEVRAATGASFSVAEIASADEDHISLNGNGQTQ
jgi:GAF domain-containing protein/HAMP domain-containing protein